VLPHIICVYTSRTGRHGWIALGNDMPDRAQLRMDAMAAKNGWQIWQIVESCLG